MKKAKSGETSPMVSKTAAAFLAMNEEDRNEWIGDWNNIKTITGWAASLVGQSPNKKKPRRDYRGFDPRDGGKVSRQRLPKKKNARKASPFYPAARPKKSSP
jgi:hypothetical protein